MKRAIVLVVMIIGIAASFPVAHACDCMTSSPEQHLMDSAVVFIGTFQGANRNINHTERNGVILLDLGTIDATFKVIGVVKGELKIDELVTVRTLSDGATCGIARWANEEPGISWVIYAHQAKGPRPKDSSDDIFSRELIPLTAETILVTDVCNGTLRTDRAAEHIRYFNSR